MSLLERLRQLAITLPPGSSVSLPRDWLLAELEVAPAPDALVGDLTVEQLAELFSKRPGTVRAWLEAGECPEAYKLNGKAWRVPRPAAMALLERKRKGKPPEGSLAADRAPASLGDWRKVRRGTA